MCFKDFRCDSLRSYPSVNTKRGYMAEIEYVEANRNDLDIVGPLWRKLMQHHIERSTHFKSFLEKATFERRAKQIRDKSEDGDIRIDLARDVTTENIIGYCVSTITRDNQGEIDSIYVEPDYRGRNIGNNLMERALRWMDSKSVTSKMLVVAAGNEEVFDFYRQYDFYPASITLFQAGNE